MKSMCFLNVPNAVSMDFFGVKQWEVVGRFFD